MRFFEAFLIDGKGSVVEGVDEECCAYIPQKKRAETGKAATWILTGDVIFFDRELFERVFIFCGGKDRNDFEKKYKIFLEGRR